MNRFTFPDTFATNCAQAIRTASTQTPRGIVVMVNKRKRGKVSFTNETLNHNAQLALMLRRGNTKCS